MFQGFSRRVLYWTTPVALMISCEAGHAKDFTVLHDFCSQRYCTDGDYPTAAVIADKDGNLYSTTYGGGRDNGNCQVPIIGCGTVFKVAPDGTETVLYAFAGGGDGKYPYAGLVMDGKGNLYGATTEGGNQGTVFKTAPDGTETTLYAFTGGNDGGTPAGTLIRDKSGNLYGTTRLGGTRAWGTVFKLAPDGTETVLYSFCSPSACTDGSDPIGGVIADANGNLYGTTQRGGANDGGTVFKIAPDGTETKLYDFCSKTGCSDGRDPQAGLTMDSKGNLYGTTFGGGSNDNGTVFKLTSNGTKYSVLHTFSGGTDGWEPYAGVILDNNGNLYGTTALGGTVGFGTVFKLAPDGTETVLHSFTHGKDGSQPNAAPMLDGYGNLYGTADYGAKTSCHNQQGCGTVFRLKK